KYGGKAGAYAADRSQGKTRSDYSVRAHAPAQAKRPYAGDDTRDENRRDQNRKKPRSGSKRDATTTMATDNSIDIGPLADSLANMNISDDDRKNITGCSDKQWPPSRPPR
ncbi:hypothetical protein BGX28_001983, partial [Mortierella sp. GBA30]